MQHYLPALVVLCMATGLGLVLASANLFIGRRRLRRDDHPYESGMPSAGLTGQRFGISFYLVAILYVIFDIEVILLFPAALALGELGGLALSAIGVFIGLLGIAFVYEWRRGSLDWR